MSMGKNSQRQWLRGGARLFCNVGGRNGYPTILKAKAGCIARPAFAFFTVQAIQ